MHAWKRVTSDVSDVYDTVTTTWIGFTHYINSLCKDLEVCYNPKE